MHDSTLEVRLLGRIDARVDGAPIRIGGRHAQALLALLVLDPRPRSRDALAVDLWPDNPTGTASLRQALWHLRSAFTAAGADPDQFIAADAETIGLVPGARIATDVARFEALVRGQAGDPDAATALYAGDLAEGFDHECFAGERERLADLYEDALAVIADRRLAAGRLDDARTTAERLIARDPLREEAHAVLIGVHARIGSRSQVVRQYRRLESLLRRELDVEPLPETLAVYRAAMASAVERSQLRVGRPAATPAFAARTRQPAPVPSFGGRTRHATIPPALGTTPPVPLIPRTRTPAGIPTPA